MEDLLALAGYAVAAFPSGEEGLEWLASHTPALILMDINLPGRDGLALTREIKGRAETGGIPVIAVTAYAMKGDRDRILAAGCDGYVSKPIDVQKFPAQIARFLAGGGGDGKAGSFSPHPGSPSQAGPGAAGPPGLPVGQGPLDTGN